MSLLPKLVSTNRYKQTARKRWKDSEKEAALRAAVLEQLSTEFSKQIPGLFVSAVVSQQSLTKHCTAVVFPFCRESNLTDECEFMHRAMQNNERDRLKSQKGKGRHPRVPYKNSGKVFKQRTSISSNKSANGTPAIMHCMSSWLLILMRVKKWVKREQHQMCTRFLRQQMKMYTNISIEIT